MTKFCENNGVIPNSQFGFRHKHSTVHAVGKSTLDISRALNEKKFVGKCLIDIEKAFDTVWREGLIFKMLQEGFTKYLIKFVWVMIRDTKFVRCYNKHHSKIIFTLADGLQQGAVNSPTLFNILIADLLPHFGIDNTTLLRGIASAGDFILYVMHGDLDRAKEILEKNFRII